MDIRIFTGGAVAPHLDDVARLRIEVFRDFPYLYDGDVGYEATYLATYAKSRESLFVLVFDGARVIGASTGLPLADETPSFQKPFVERGIDLGRVFYFGESVLLPAYRGQGIGHRFFDEREAYARQLGRFTMTAFCAVVRAEDDPRRPPGHRPNDVFWTRRGYVQQPDMHCAIEWKEVGANAPSVHPLAFWLRPLEAK
ncbi:MAG TPA: GNAT family N-acetyltransferase [Dokdonella sp.]|uniref:GNAT family N-acetyltransferase n=1 Tax=Dokdonella sp. TaxID=2291710 RepID=UPI0025BE936B|nr:GNAT family N-acetyltransferase [Dokdonella sp.]MBX3692702.1 GNAT family N-acetyltransferase [Dokdonella sp.]MCW5568066.1 GNAT family N-acetyltransferase [Dokdonella sp.]HNR91349.1 GNAT family N-acetyltransferase [Dokdonella sp.]